MTRFLAMLAFASLSLFARADGPAQDARTQDEQAWIRAVQPYYVDAKAANIDSIVGLVADADQGASPVALMYRKEKKQCVFLVLSRNNAASDALQDLLPLESGREVARAMAAAHEYGHCVHNSRLTAKSPGSELLPETASPVAERLADIFALAWFAKNRPDDFDNALKFMRRLRALRWQGHMYENAYANVDKAADLRERMAARPADPFDYAAHLVLNLPLPAVGGSPQKVLTAKAD